MEIHPVQFPAPHRHSAKISVQLREGLVRGKRPKLLYLAFGSISDSLCEGCAIESSTSIFCVWVSWKTQEVLPVRSSDHQQPLLAVSILMQALSPGAPRLLCTDAACWPHPHAGSVPRHKRQHRLVVFLCSRKHACEQNTASFLALVASGFLFKLKNKQTKKTQSVYC